MQINLSRRLGRMLSFEWKANARRLMVSKKRMRVRRLKPIAVWGRTETQSRKKKSMAG